MNIGETDADGWTYVSWIDAANAYALKTHETELSVTGGRFITCDGFFDRGSHKYRVREKARTITVTILRPIEVAVSLVPDRLILVFSTPNQRDLAYQATLKAMEQS